LVDEEAKSRKSRRERRGEGGGGGGEVYKCVVMNGMKGCKRRKT
jgi:hypothetical protein